MKNFFAFCAAVAAITGVTGTLSACDPEPEQPNVTTVIQFSDVEAEYYFDAGWGPETVVYDERVRFDKEFGIYEIHMSFQEYNNIGYPVNGSLDLEFCSDYVENAMEAIPAEGEYVMSLDYEKQTFNADGRTRYEVYLYEYYECSMFVDGWYPIGRSNRYGIAGGSFTVTHRAGGFVIDFDLMLENGKRIKGSHDGVMRTTTSPPNDISVDTGDLYKPAFAYEAEECEDMWYIYFEAEDNATEMYLAINTESGLDRLPEGRFEMATETEKGIPGTAEPTSLFYGGNVVYGHGDIVCQAMGCQGYNSFYYRDGDYVTNMLAVPGKGFVDITDEGDGDYSIEFSYEMPNGKTVSGSYTGLVANIASDPDDYMARSFSPARANPAAI